MRGRLGTVLVNGSFVNATVVASGVSDVYLSGLKGTAMANLAGAADLLVNASVGARCSRQPCAWLPAGDFLVCMIAMVSKESRLTSKERARSTTDAAALNS